jgi:predicted metal-dependent hydrolase
MLKIDRIIRTRRRTIALRIERDGSLTVRAPLRATEKDIFPILEQHQIWIRKTQEKMRARSLLFVEKTYTEGDSFWYLGQQYPLHLVNGARRLLEFKEQFILDRRALANPQEVFKNWYRKQAQAILSARVAEYAAKYGFSYRQVKITSARTRWGSCNSKGTLSFPWRLVMAPLPVIDYVVVHELVHTREHNHGPHFWQKVAAIVPDFQTKRKWLDDHSVELTL